MMVELLEISGCDFTKLNSYCGRLEDTSTGFQTTIYKTIQTSGRYWKGWALSAWGGALVGAAVQLQDSTDRIQAMRERLGCSVQLHCRTTSISQKHRNNIIKGKGKF